MPAAVQALSYFPELKVILASDRNAITSHYLLLGRMPDSRLSIQHCDRVISNSEKPSLALRNSQVVLLRAAIDLAAESQADACVSGGNTGALMALVCFRLKLLPGIDSLHWFQLCLLLLATVHGCLI